MNHIYLEGYIYYLTIITQNRLNLFVRPGFVIPIYDSLNFYRHKPGLFSSENIAFNISCDRLIDSE